MTASLRTAVRRAAVLGVCAFALIVPPGTSGWTTAQAYANAGFDLDIGRTVPRGTSDLVVFAQCAQTGTFEIVRVTLTTMKTTA